MGVHSASQTASQHMKIKLSLWFSFFRVFFVSSGNLVRVIYVESMIVLFLPMSAHPSKFAKSKTDFLSFQLCDVLR